MRVVSPSPFRPASKDDVRQRASSAGPESQDRLRPAVAPASNGRLPLGQLRRTKRSYRPPLGRSAAFRGACFLLNRLIAHLNSLLNAYLNVNGIGPRSRPLAWAPSAQATRDRYY